ncbi:GspE/PulE family protein [Hydrogenophaga sp.]|uniref:GspE/PulE family protein n=1 Tax=Hydrogenophaga sp. TaxID=1904254 RepID=UPI0025B99AFC|nr:GspE/PulE family protein [Hydrogenophaga sp.]MBT9463079.1 type II/IV secretion system protein [Hydrogenophaga sp.]
MNAPREMQHLAQAFSVAELQQARAAALTEGLSLIAWLEGHEGQQGLPGGWLARLAATAGVPALGMDELHALQPAFDLLPYGDALQRECLLMRAEPAADGTEGDLVLVMADPFNTDLLAWAEERVRQPKQLRLAHRADIAAYLARHEDSLRAMDSLAPMQQAAGATEGEDISLRSISEDASPVVRLVNSTLYDALKSGASDIHLETAGGGIYIKYRIDGVLASVGGIHGSENAEQVISRIKVMAELDIAERRVPQDGRFKVAALGRDIDIRVSIMPSIHGEDAVLRVLDKERLSDQVTGLRLEALGFDPQTMRALRALCQEPYGMLLATGPTGSGKTTTLYAAINEINHGHDKIVTIEDPVEYQLTGVLQIPVNEKKGLTFARGLRSILRHDPDKIMVGEIRDGETAQIAVQAALTGHLVLTTVHANNVFDVLGRFTHMGVDPYSLVAALNGIVAQRLVRVNCPDCAVHDTPSAELLAESGLGEVSGFRFMAGRGCASCRGTGFKGRKAVAEVLMLDDELREMIVTKEPVRRIKEAAHRKGTRVLRDVGLDLVRQGETTLQELNRVVR